MLEIFRLKRCLTTTILSIVSWLLALGMCVIVLLTYYQKPETYKTEQDVKNSRAYEAVADAAETLFIDSLSDGQGHWETYNFTIEEIGWIYESDFSDDGYTVYSRFEYTTKGEKETACYKTWCGEIRTKHGVKDGIETKSISETAYSKENSRLINSEKIYNEFAVSVILSSLADGIGPSGNGYSALVTLFQYYPALHNADIESISYTKYAFSSKSVDYLLKVDFTDANQTHCTEYYYCLGSSGKNCVNLTKSQYDLSLEEYLTGEKANRTTQGTCHNLVILSALNQAKEAK